MAYSIPLTAASETEAKIAYLAMKYGGDDYVSMESKIHCSCN